MNQLDHHPTKIPYSNPKMNRWKSWRANTQFAPNFDIPIYTDQYEESLALGIAKQISDNDVTYFDIGYMDQICSSQLRILLRHFHRNTFLFFLLSYFCL